MRVRLLGAHQAGSRDMDFMSILVDGRLAIDAGGILSALTLEEQYDLEAVLITHLHWDHIRDLPGLAHNHWMTKTLVLYCIDSTRQALEQFFFNDVIWPTMQQDDGGRHPLVYNHVEPGREFSVAGYRVVPVEVSHTVPTVGYYIERGGKSLFYTADTRGEGKPPWSHLRPDLLLAETTLSNAYSKEADKFGHMTPERLERELVAFHENQGYFPHTRCVHINPHHEERIREELAEVAARLHADVAAGHEGMVIEW